jgi:phage-related protein
MADPADPAPPDPPSPAAGSPLSTPPPSTAGITAVQGQATGAIGEVTGKLATLDPSHPDSPLAGVGKAISAVDEAAAKVDVTGLSDQLPAALGRLNAAIPPSALDAVGSLDKSYDRAHTLLTGGPLSKLTFGRKLQDVAQEVIGDAISAFEQELDRLAAEVFDPETLALIKEGLKDLVLFAQDFAANSKNFLAFLSRNLIGVADDLLAEVSSELAKILAGLGPIAADALTVIDTLEHAAADALAELTRAIDALERAGAAAEAQAYADLLKALDDLERSAETLIARVTDILDRLATALDGLDLSQVMVEYAALLRAVDIGEIPTIDDAVEALAGLLDGLAARAVVVAAGDELPAQVELLVRTIDDTVATAGLHAARDTVHAAFVEVQGAIAQIPTEEIQKGIDAMLGAVAAEIQSLHLDQVTQQIKDGLAEVAKEVDTATSGLADTVSAEVEQLVAGIADLDLGSVTDEILRVIKEAGDLIGELENLAKDNVGVLTDALAEFDKISFKPLADEAIGEIDDIRKRLEKIDPSALSAPERLAIAAALTVLEAIDVEGHVITTLEGIFDQARMPLDQAIDLVAMPLETLGRFIGELDPAKLVGPVDDLLVGLEKEIDKLDAEVLLRPLRAEVDKLLARLGDLNPGALVKPLEAPYHDLVDSVGRLDPTVWVAPLKGLYTKIDEVIGKLDITPLFDELDKLRRELLTKASGAVIAGLKGLDLPAPVTALLTEVTTTVDAIGVALFDDPEKLAGAIPPTIDLTTPLMLLDAPFDELVALVGKVPAKDLTEAANALRQTFGPGLAALDPRALVAELRAGAERLDALDPAVLLPGTAAALPALRARLAAAVKAAPPGRAADAAAVGARLDRILQTLDAHLPQSDLAKLAAAHLRVSDVLGRALDTLDPAVAVPPYLDLRRDLARIVPPFLAQHDPLTRDDVVKGLAALRPSAHAPRLKTSLAGFRAGVAPLQARIAVGFDALLAAIRRALTLVDPLVFKADVAAVYAEVRAKVRVIDPDQLAKDGGAVLTAVQDQLKAIDPAAIGAALDATYHEVADAVKQAIDGVLDAIASAIDLEVTKVRDALKGIVTAFHQALDDAVAEAGSLTKDLESLVLVAIVDRLKHFTENLAKSLDIELQRVRKAFDSMLDAIPLEKDKASAPALAA